MANVKFAAPFIIKKEGGLSRAKTDTAHKNPAPWTYTAYDHSMKKTVTASDWHTNKGITYKLFKNLSTKLGYADSAENFFGMPDWLWDKIFAWHFDQVGGKDLISDVIATYATSWVWGGGGVPELKKFLKSEYDYTANSLRDVVNGLNSLTKKDELGLFNAMLDWRAKYFKSLNQPANLRGWLDRLNLYRTNLTPYIQKKK